MSIFFSDFCRNVIKLEVRFWGITENIGHKSNFPAISWKNGLTGAV